MKLVVDASVALKWVVNEPGKAEADAVFRHELFAPELMQIEAANGLWAMHRKGLLTTEVAAEALTRLLAAPVVWSSRRDDSQMALRLGLQLQHPAYDCLYLAIAIRENTQVVTADARFLRAVASDPALAGRVRPLV